MTRLQVRHLTRYHYARPVTFGEHRAMFRPRDSHDLRILDTALSISPTAEVRWMHDVFSNSIAVIGFHAPGTELTIESRVRIEHYGIGEPPCPLDDHARHYPFAYHHAIMPDLEPTRRPSYPDSDDQVGAWARGFLDDAASTDTWALLERMNEAVHRGFAYRERLSHGVQSPLETLDAGGGTCRDFALLMMEAVRHLGLAARFVTGYLYDPALDGAESGLAGSGHTHAWVQVFLPGAGWVEFDPTNGLIGGRNLIRVAVARDPAQAIPLEGSYAGRAEDFLRMEVEVEVTAVDADHEVLPALATSP